MPRPKKQLSEAVGGEQPAMDEPQASIEAEPQPKPRAQTLAPPQKKLSIRSIRPSFWRCGHQFSSQPQVFAEGHFSEEQLKLLKAESNLKVIEQ